MKTLIAALTTAALAGGGVVLAVDAGQHGSRKVTPISNRTDSVALLTGDQVVLGPQGTNTATPVPAKGRPKAQFTTRQEGKHRYVIPADAAPLVTAGKLDLKLFDVNLLQQKGYTSKGYLQLIVQSGSAPKSLAGASIIRTLPAMNAVAVRIPAGDSTFWQTLTQSTAKTGGLQQGVARHTAGAVPRPQHSTDRRPGRLGSRVHRQRRESRGP